MRQISFGRTKIKYEIRRSNRKKTVGLVVQPNTYVIVLSPRFLSENNIKQIVLKRAGWIIKHQDKIRRFKADTHPKKDFVSGETFPYLGRHYRLKIIRSVNKENTSCKLVGGRLYIKTNKRVGDKATSRVIRENLIEWYRARAEKKIKERLRDYAKLIGKRPIKVIVKNQGKRWGSCSNSGVLRFNWKVIMAPLSVVDYVIVHELCHLIIKNHSEKFWNKLGSIIPDYKKKRQWLKENSYLLTELLQSQ